MWTFPRLAEATPEDLDAFATFGSLVDPSDVPALVRSGVSVWSFGYGWDQEDDGFTTIEEDDLWAWGVTPDDCPGGRCYGHGADPDVVASWGPFRVER